MRHPLLAPLAVAIIASCLIFALAADVFHPAMDEGIYLYGGQRVAAGQVIYKDFFAYTGPLLYWLLAGMERLVGPNLPLLRLCLAIPLGLICGAVFHIVARRSGWVAAALTTGVYLGLTLHMSMRLSLNHRWLSAAFYMLGAALLLEGEDTGRRRTYVGAGALLALAAWTTPTFLAPLAAIALCLLAIKSLRPQLWPLLAGVAGVSLPLAAVLAAQGALSPMMELLLWASGPYRRANSLPFGFLSGFQERWAAGGFAALPRLVLTLWPALLLVASLLAAAFDLLTKRASRMFLLTAVLAAGMAATAYPRWDAIQLVYVTPLAAALMGWWCAARLPGWLQRAVLAVAAVAALYGAAQTVMLMGSYSGFSTRVGLLRRTVADADALEKLERLIPAGATVYVHPYFPLVTYLLQARNAASYEWLQPGMMTREDESRVLRQLQAAPPRFVIQQYLPPEAVLAVWPNSDRTLLHYEAIEEFIGANYLAVETVEAPNFRLTVMERVGPEAGR